MTTNLTANSDERFEKAIHELTEMYKKHRYLNISYSTGKQRTGTQNNAMHLYFTQLAKALNDAGYTVAMVLKKPLNISWSGGLVKELLWRQVQDAIVDKDSTAELERQECSQIYDEVNRAVVERTGVSIPFPSRD